MGVAVLALAGAVVLVWTLSVSAQAGTLSIHKSVDAVNVHPNDRVTYTVVFTNDGTIATQAWMTDIIPSGVTYVVGSVTGVGAAYYPGPPAYIGWNGTLGPGDVYTVTFQVDVVGPGTLGPLPIRNQATINTTWSNAVYIYSTPAQIPMPITKFADRTDVHPGDYVTYTLVFTNTASVVATAVMTDVIPSGVVYDPGSVTGGATYVPGPPAYISYVGVLNPGQQAVVTFRVQVVQPGTAGPLPILNEACVNGSWSNAVIVNSTRGGILYLPVVWKGYVPRPPWPWSQPGAYSGGAGPTWISVEQ